MADLTHFEAERLGDRRKVVAVWTNVFKKTATVKITEDKAEHGAPTVLIEGEAGHVDRTLAGIATIAWNMGWRPKGLVPSIANLITKVKEPVG